MDEMKLVESFCAEQPPPDPQRLDRARHELARQLAQSGRRVDRSWSARGSTRSRPDRRQHSRRRYGLRAAAIAVIIAGLTIITAVMTSSPSRPAAVTPGLPSGQVNSTVPAGHHHDHRLIGRPIKLTVDVLHRAATAALTAPAPRDNQFLYTIMRAVPGPRGAALVFQTWQSVNGRRAGAVRTTPGCGRKRSCLAELPARRERGQQIPLDRTYAGLRTLPTNPTRLLAYLERNNTCSGIGDAHLPVGEAAYAEITMILITVQVLPPRIGSALFNAAAEIPGITVIDNVKDAAGGYGVAVSMTFRTSHSPRTRYELIFNPRTYRYIGQQFITVGPGGKEHLFTASEVLHSQVVNSAPTRYTREPAPIGQHGIPEVLQTGTPTCVG